MPSGPFDLVRVGRDLPFAEALPALEDALHSACVVVEAPPGTGKTTIVPPALANTVAGRVVVAQPRRLAARAAAARLAALAGVRVGAEVGHTVRGDSRTSAATRVEFCTTGVLLRRLLNDPDLTGIDAVVIDEVHERHLDGDLVLAMTRELIDLRDDLRLVVMSATLDTRGLATLLGDGGPAPVVGVESVLHPLELRWRPPAGAPMDARGVTREFLTHVASVVGDTLTDTEGDALVFLPGVRDVEEVVARLAPRVDADVLPLHGRLSGAQQDAALRPGTRRRVVVSTAVAESSLTVPGVRLVVDAGLSREPRHDAARGMSGLVTTAVSRSSAEQRAGRAARLGPGVAVRCYSQESWARLPERARPEVLVADLTQAVLDLACWGAPRGAGLALPDPLPHAATERAEELLGRLGAVDHDGVTARGRAMAGLPVEPRLARALLDGAAVVGRRAAAEAVAVLALDERPPGGDLTALLRRVRDDRRSTWAREAERLEKLAPGPPDSSRADGRTLALATAYAYPERIARRRGDTDAYQLASGTAADLPRDTGLRGAPWLAVAEVVRAATPNGAVIRAAVPIDEADALEAGVELLTDRTEATWRDGRVTARRVTALGAIELTTTPVRATPDDRRRAVAAELSASGLDLLDWPPAATALRRRLAYAHAHLGAPWPAVDDAALLAGIDVWLGPELERLADGVPASRLDLTAALRRLLPWPEAARLDELVPESLTVPTGSRVRLDYADDPTQSPVLAVKLQECFGLTDTPRILDGRVPVVFHLLSPARRPLAVTADLASFWANAYAGVRAENRGRYSKHPWPEDPLVAPPQKGTRASGR